MSYYHFIAKDKLLITDVFFKYPLLGKLRYYKYDSQNTFAINILK